MVFSPQVDWNFRAVLLNIAITSHISIIYCIQNAFEFNRFPGTPEGIHYISFPKLMSFYLHKNTISSQLPIRGCRRALWISSQRFSYLNRSRKWSFTFIVDLLPFITELYNLQKNRQALKKKTFPAGVYQEDKSYGCFRINTNELFFKVKGEIPHRVQWWKAFNTWSFKFPFYMIIRISLLGDCIKLTGWLLWSCHCPYLWEDMRQWSGWDAGISHPHSHSQCHLLRFP